jgi:superfamily II DNA or RNA helicase
MTLQLRPDQVEFIDAIRAAFRGGARRVLAVAPTGMGKTVCATHMIGGAVALGNRAMFAAGRTELIDQTAATLRAAGLDDIRIIQADRDEGRADAPVIVGSVQTFSSPRWRGLVPLVQLLILDEAHHCGADQYGSLVLEQPEARTVGLSATPERADGKPLGDVFDALVSGPSVAALTDAGHLVRCRIWAGPSTLKSGELAMTPLEAYQRFAAGQRAGVFCRDVAHAEAELACFTAAGVPAAIVTGAMARRRRAETLQRWRDGDILVVTSVGVLTEGFDLPQLGVAILARRFNHVGQYLQVGGRILRPYPGKTEAFLIDLGGCAHEHGPLELERAYSLTGRAISGGAREAFGHCRACGSMFRYGPSRCPHCGEEIATRPTPPPRSVDAGVTELTPARARIPWVSSLLAKRDGHCAKCARWFPRGTPIYWTSGKRGSARHQKCPLPSVGVGP